MHISENIQQQKQKWGWDRSGTGKVLSTLVIICLSGW